MITLGRLLFGISVLVTLLPGCSLSRTVAGQGGDAQVALPHHVSEMLELVAAQAPQADQVLYVDPAATQPGRATLYAVERGFFGWQLALPPVAANLGRNGSAPPWEKREGDGRTPSGIFPLPLSFGYRAAAPGRLPYRQVTAQDLWVDDPQSPDYNLWVRRGETKAASFEELLRADQLYSVALVIGYNSEPVLRGLGSAIFLHVERGAGVATAGCVSVPEPALVGLLSWLDPARHPYLAVGSPSALRAVAAGMASRLPGDLPEPLRERLQQGRPLALRRGGGYFGAAVSLPPKVEGLMLERQSWRRGCPVPLAELSYLVVNFWGFDGGSHYGELVLHASLAPLMLDALQTAYQSRFPIRSLKLADEFDADDERSMSANNSSAFNCREVPGKPGVFSRHSFGTALDLNPLQNPFLRLDSEALKQLGWSGEGSPAEFVSATGWLGAATPAAFCTGHPEACLIAPAEAAGYLERHDPRPGMLVSGDPVLKSFGERGFSWGGLWRIPDYQHLDYPPERLAGPRHSQQRP